MRDIDKIVYGSVIGGLSGMFLGSFSFILSFISALHFLATKSKFTGYLAVSSFLMGASNMIEIYFYEYAPSTSFLFPIAHLLETKSQISAFTVLNSDPSKLRLGQVWFNSSDSQFKGYNGNDIVILG